MRETALIAGVPVRFVMDRVPLFVRDLLGYGAVSAAALACDYGLLLCLHAHGLHYLAAQAISFSAGMTLAYSLSARFVFATRRDQSRVREITGFVLAGIAGLIPTQILLGLLVSGLAIPVAFAKLPVACGVFLFNFVARRSLVFSGARAALP